MGSTVWCLSCLFAVLPECIRSFTWWAFWSLLGGNPSFHGVVAIMFSNNDCVVVEKSIFRSLLFSVCVCVLQQRFHAYKSWTLQSYCLFRITKQGTGEANNAGKSNQTGTPTTEVYHISKSSVAWHWHLFPGSRPQCQPPHHPQSPPSGRWDGRWPS